MDDLLRPVSTAYKVDDQKQVHLVEVHSPPPTSRAPTQSSIRTPSRPEEALEVLKSEPDISSLGRVLDYLAKTNDLHLDFPSALGSQLINALVSDIVPTYWSLLSEKRKGTDGWLRGIERAQLLQVLRNVSGLGAMVAKLKALIEERRRASQLAGGMDIGPIVGDYLHLLAALLENNDVLETFHTKLSNAPNGLKHALWQEIAALIGGGRVLSIAAEAQSVMTASNKSVDEPAWIADSQKYSRWIGQNLCQWAGHLPISKGDEVWNALSVIMRKALRLGHADAIQEVLIHFDLANKGFMRRLLDTLPTFEQKAFLFSTIRLLTKRYLSKDTAMAYSEWWKADSDSVAAVAAFLQSMVEGIPSRTDLLVSWLTSINASGIGEPVAIRRSVLAVIAGNKQAMDQVLDKSMQQFGDQLFIKHAPSLQQDVQTQVLLLAAGYVHRSSPFKLKMLQRSSAYLNAVSNRLASSSNRARLLGMIVGEVISALTEPEGKSMDFKMEELQTDEVKWYKSLVCVEDFIGSIEVLCDMSRVGIPIVKESKPNMAVPRKTNKRTSAPQIQTSKIISIDELDDDDDDDDDDDELMTYGKPDSDAEDSDDDPTLITRNKPSAPVYIRDLISYFRDAENYDRQKLALTTAASLIRRKANFGAEVKDHVEELATLLMGLQDKYDIENFNELRIQAMIAILLSNPTSMGKWYSKTFFDGDYSVSQRASVLSTITMAARELAGYQEEDKSLTKASADAAFPSQRLPARLEVTWRPNEIDALAEKMSKVMIQPMAAHLADQATGPNVLKVRTFSSRLAVESRRAAPTVNNLSKIIADSFFYPLTGRFFAYFKAHGRKSVIFESYLLSSYVKTLSLLLHASGINTLQLPQMTREYWDLLLVLRGHTVGDKAVGEAVLFGFMTILELNQDQRRLAEQHGREMLETQRWVEAFFSTLGEGKEEERARTLAAGVLFRLREVVQKYQALLMGDLASF